MPSRILYVVNSAEFFLSHRLPIALAARDAGFEVHVATPPGPAVEEIRSHGFEHHVFPLGRKSLAPWSELRTFFALWALYRTLRPTLVHHVALKAVLYGTAAARLTGVPAIVNAVTGLGYLFCQRGLKGALLRALALLFFRPVLRASGIRVIFQNPDDQAEFEAAKVIHPGQAVLIRGSGVPMSRYLAAREPEGTPVVLFASRMLWDKGVGEFVEAARILEARGVAARFVLAGGTDEHNPKAVPSAELESWQRAGVVEWWGHRTDMPEVFAKSAVVVFPSIYREGVPKVLIEAAACARPIVTTDMPGCREIVRNGLNGLLVPNRDATAVADAVQRLLEDPALRGRMGEAGRALVQGEFALEIVIRSTLDVYREQLGALLPDPALRLSA